MTVVVWVLVVVVAALAYQVFELRGRVEVMNEWWEYFKAGVANMQWEESTQKWSAAGGVPTSAGKE